MQLTKKTVIWAETGTATKPNDAKIAAGWKAVPPEQPPADYFNWILQSDEESIADLQDSNNAIDANLAAVITAAGGTPSLAPGEPTDQLLVALQTGALIVEGSLGDGLSLNHFSQGHIVVSEGNPATEDVFTVSLYPQYVGVTVSQIAGGSRSFLLSGSVTSGQAGLSLFKSGGGADTTSVYVLSNGGIKSTNQTSLQTVEIDPTAVIVKNLSESIATTISRRGTRNHGSSSPGDDTVYMRDAVWSLDTSVFSTVVAFYSGVSEVLGGGGSVDDHYHKAGWEITANGVSRDTPVPNGCPVYSLTVRYTDTGGHVHTAPCKVQWAAGATYQQFERLTILSLAEPDIAQTVKLLASFDAASL